MRMNIDNINRYKNVVERLAESKSNFIFPNSSHQHAAIVLENMIRYCDDEFRIFDIDLSGDITRYAPDFIQTIEDGARKKKIFKFVIVDNSHRDTDICAKLATLSELFPDRVFVRLASEDFKKRMESVPKDVKLDEISIIRLDATTQPRQVNFAVGDKRSFRLEFLNNNERKAFCSFNNEFFPQLLVKAFDDGFKSCTPFFGNDASRADAAV